MNPSAIRNEWDAKDLSPLDALVFQDATTGEFCCAYCDAANTSPAGLRGCVVNCAHCGRSILVPGADEMQMLSGYQEPDSQENPLVNRLVGAFFGGIAGVMLGLAASVPIWILALAVTIVAPLAIGILALAAVGTVYLMLVSGSGAAALGFAACRARVTR
jgi:hypothetical protein